ncbi:hypothetical protein FQZ97_1049820 [compost metagenome]
MGSRTLPQYIGLSSSWGSAFGKPASRPVFSNHNSSCDLYGFRPTAAAASELPMPCLRICSQSSRGSSLVLTRRRAGRFLRVLLFSDVAFMLLTCRHKNARPALG